MNNPILKKILLAVMLVAIVGVIIYINSTKAHPSAAGTGAAAPQDISLMPPSGGAGVSTTAQPSGSGAASGSQAPSAALAKIAADDKAAGYQPAIEIANPTGFINASSSFKLANLIGKKVILVDFWTYSCINCIRTLPYLTSWYEKYKDQGLEVVGIHTPEFDFEKDITNVRAATKQYGINYPVILDSNYGTWDAYNNLYWPHEFLIDIAGYIVHDHIGEGDYDTTEGIIQQLLQQRATALGASAVAIPTSVMNAPAPDLSGIGSPETYFGSGRNQYLANGTPLVDGSQTLAAPSTVALNNLYLVGNWNFQSEFATNASAGAKVIYKYDSLKVYIVASAPQGAIVQVLQDGAPVTAANAGTDVHNDVMTIGTSRLYNVIDNHGVPGEHTLELIIDSPGLQAFTFTFG